MDWREGLKDMGGSAVCCSAAATSGSGAVTLIMCAGAEARLTHSDGCDPSSTKIK